MRLVRHQLLLALPWHIAEDSLGDPGLIGPGEAAARKDIVGPVLQHPCLAPHVLPGVADRLCGDKPHQHRRSHNGGHNGQAPPPDTALYLG